MDSYIPGEQLTLSSSEKLTQTTQVCFCDELEGTMKEEVDNYISNLSDGLSWLFTTWIIDGKGDKEYYADCFEHLLTKDA